MSLTEEKSNKTLKIGVLVVGGLLIAAGVTPFINSYLLSDDKHNESEQIVDTQPLSEIIESPEADNTVPQEQTDFDRNTATEEHSSTSDDPILEKEPLPALHDSDLFFLENINQASAKSLFSPLDIIRNMVVFVDNFSRGELVSNFSPLETPNQPFSVSKQKGITIVNSDSYLRYDKYAKAVSDIDSDAFLVFYQRLTPLIDEAYQEIGYPPGSFTETFDKAINHVLETPVIHYKLEVTSSSVMYQYVDKNLESLPDSQKMLLRMGPDNLQVIKEKLQEIQNELQRL